MNSLFLSIPNETSKYYGNNLEIAKRYFTKLTDVPTPRKNLFLKEKSKNSYRIFILGESTTGVKEEQDGIPTEYSISQNYPNPFNLTTKIKFALLQSMETKLTVYVLLGEKCKR